jgi:hypothetical protein
MARFIFSGKGVISMLVDLANQTHLALLFANSPDRLDSIAVKTHYLFAGFVTLTALLSACVSGDDGIPNFERMSPTELAEYNSGRPLDQMIVCSDEASTMSRVRRRRCMTVDQMYGSRSNIEKINALNATGVTIQ